MAEMDKNVNRDGRGNTSNCVLIVCISMLTLLACSGNPPAPVEERRVSSQPRHRLLPAPDIYVVKRGDTLYAIAFRFGLDYGDIARWNQLQSTDLIRTGQRLKLKPPAATAKKPAITKPPPRSRPASRPYEPPPAVAQQKPGTGTAATKEPKSTSPGKSGPVPPSTAKVSWQWPASGKIIQTFKANDPARPGLDIGGTEGQAIQAAASGLVVYSGSGLIGYGELIIIKHNDRLLSAYAHNRKRIVRENDQVKAGQKIAEMGRNGSNRVMLHFEIREHGSPVDPKRYLPGR